MAAARLASRVIDGVGKSGVMILVTAIISTLLNRVGKRMRFQTHSNRASPLLRETWTSVGENRLALFQRGIAGEKVRQLTTNHPTDLPDA